MSSGAQQCVCHLAGPFMKTPPLQARKAQRGPTLLDDLCTIEYRLEFTA
jgi:hypothetical protein